MAVINPASEGGMQDVRHLLARYAGRIRLERRHRYLSLSFLVLGVAWVLAALLFYADLLNARFLPYALLLPLLLPIAALSLERLRKPSAIETAQAIDLRLDNQQRVLTAVELMGASEPRSLDTAQLASTIDYVVPLDARVVYPVRSGWPAYSFSGGLILLAVGILLLKSAPAGFVPIQSLGLPGEQSALSALASPTAASGLPGADEQPEATPTTQADTSQAAGADPGQNSIAPSPEQQAASADAQAALDRLQQGLSEQSVTQGAADSLQQGDYNGASDKLAEVGRENDQLSESAKRGLADSLDRAADDTGATPDLQQAERSAAEALRKGNYKQINEALENLAQELKDTAQNVIPQQEMAQGFPQQGQQGQQGQEGQQQPGQTGQDTQPSSQQGQQGQQSGGQGQQGSEQSDGSQGSQSQGSQQGDQGDESGQGQGQSGQQGSEGQQGQGAGGGQEQDSQGEGQAAAPGQGTRIDGPKDATDPDVEGNPFELENQPDQGKPSQDGERPALTLEGSGGTSGASPVAPGSAVTAPGESNRLPVERWQVIQRYFTRER